MGGGGEGAEGSERPGQVCALDIDVPGEGIDSLGRAGTLTPSPYPCRMDISILTNGGR